MPEYIVEVLVVVEADSRTDAEAWGERAADAVRRGAHAPASVARSRIVNVILSDVRSDEDGGEDE